VGCREEFLSKEVPIVLYMAILVQRRRGSWGRFSLGRVFGEFLDRTGLTGFPCLCGAKSNRTGLAGFRNRLDRFGLPVAVSCVFPLRVCCGYWLGLAPRSISTSVAAWTWQEKLAEVNEWNRVHRPNSWIEFLSAPIHSPPLVRHFGTSVVDKEVITKRCFWFRVDA
jgi:hypothetical protein